MWLQWVWNKQQSVHKQWGLVCSSMGGTRIIKTVPEFVGEEFAPPGISNTIKRTRDIVQTWWKQVEIVEKSD